MVAGDHLYGDARLPACAHGRDGFRPWRVDQGLDPQELQSLQVGQVEIVVGERSCREREDPLTLTAQVFSARTMPGGSRRRGPPALLSCESHMARTCSMAPLT
jgi:hypothetical protein